MPGFVTCGPNEALVVSGIKDNISFFIFLFIVDEISSSDMHLLHAVSDFVTIIVGFYTYV